MDKGKSKITSKTILKHSLYWIAIYLLMIISYRLFADDLRLKTDLILTANSLLHQIIPVYFHFYLWDKYLLNKKYLLYILFVLILIGVFGQSTRYFHSILYSGSSTDGFLATIFAIYCTVGFRYMKKQRDHQILLLEAQQKQTETELKLLKWQVNPHFLFNTLNNLYGIARKADDNATADGILKLSNMMRYILKESSDNLIEIKNELNHINSFIELQNLRFTEEDNIDIKLEFDVPDTEIKITPMLLIPFIENAYKHGISLNRYSYIHIVLQMNGKNLLFKIENSIHKNTVNDVESHSIGLTNVKRRLELLYPNKHKLNIQKNENKYSVDLEVELT